MRVCLIKVAWKLDIKGKQAGAPSLLCREQWHWHRLSCLTMGCGFCLCSSWHGKSQISHNLAKISHSWVKKTVSKSIYQKTQETETSINYNQWTQFLGEWGSRNHSRARLCECRTLHTTSKRTSKLSWQRHLYVTLYDFGTKQISQTFPC